MSNKLTIKCVADPNSTVVTYSKGLRIILVTDEPGVYLNPADARELAAFLLEQARVIEKLYPETKEVSDIRPFMDLLDKLEDDDGARTDEEDAGFQFAIRKIREKVMLRWS